MVLEDLYLQMPLLLNNCCFLITGIKAKALKTPKESIPLHGTHTEYKFKEQIVEIFAGI